MTVTLPHVATCEKIGAPMSPKMEKSVGPINVSHVNSSKTQRR